MINKQMSASLKNFWLTNLKSYLLVCFTVHILYTFFYLKNERIAHSFFFGEQCEQITQVAHQK